MSEPRESAGLPPSVKAAAALFVLAGTALLLNATVMQGAGGWFTARTLPWAMIPLIGAGVVAWGLIRGARWAWWLGIVMAACWLFGGALTVLVPDRGDVYWLPPSGFQLLLVVSLGAVALALTLLLSPSARNAFRGPPV